MCLRKFRGGVLSAVARSGRRRGVLELSVEGGWMLVDVGLNFYFSMLLEEVLEGSVEFVTALVSLE